MTRLCLALLAIVVGACVEPPPKWGGLPLNESITLTSNAVGPEFRIDGLFLTTRVEGAEGSQQLIVELDMTVHNTRVAVFTDGRRTSNRKLLIDMDRFLLVVDGVEHAPIDAFDLPTGFEDHVISPAEGAHRARGILRWQLPLTAAPQRVWLKVHEFSDDTWLHLWGGSEVGPEGVQVHLDVRGVGDAGDAQVVLGRGNERVTARAIENSHLFTAWVQPGRWTIDATSPQGMPRSVELDVDADTSWIPIVLEPIGTDDAGRIAQAFRPGHIDPPSFDVEALSDRLKTPDDVTSWIAENVTLVPSLGFQSGPNRVIRDGQGGVLDVAALAATLMARQREPARYACTDLPDLVNEQMYAPTPRRLVQGLSTTWSDRLAISAQTARDRGRLGASALASPAPPDRSKYTVSPEFCWIQRYEDGDWFDLSFLDSTRDKLPIPPAWDHHTSLRRMTWYVIATFSGVLPGEEPTEADELIKYDITMPVFGDRALVFDAYPTEQEGIFTTRLTLITPQVASGQTGKDVDLTERDLVMSLRLVDPIGIESRSYSTVLRTASGNPANGPTGSMRVLLSGDPGGRSPQTLASMLHTLHRGHHPAPDTIGQWATHALFSLLRAQADPEAWSARPEVFVSRFDTDVDGTTTRRFQVASGRTPEDGDPAGAFSAGMLDVAVADVMTQLFTGVPVDRLPTSSPQIRTEHNGVTELSWEGWTWNQSYALVSGPASASPWSAGTPVGPFESPKHVFESHELATRCRWGEAWARLTGSAPPATTTCPPLPSGP